MKVGPQGGFATSLATEAEGVPFRFTNDVDIDTEGNVYFTDSSTKYQRRLLVISLLVNTKVWLVLLVLTSDVILHAGISFS